MSARRFGERERQRRPLRPAASADTSCSEQVASAARMRSLIRHSGSRTLHFAVLAAVLRFGRARGDRQRAVDRLDDVGDRDRARRLRAAGNRRACPGATSAARAAPAAAAPWPSARPGCRYCSAISRALADAEIGARGEMLHRHQRVVGFFRKSQHQLIPSVVQRRNVPRAASNVQRATATTSPVAASPLPTCGPSSSPAPTRRRPWHR